ncbi:MAG: DUF192 domain-containing protein [Treponema sp.]|nr:DUF192 domain-containing protein [Candidatus Treponema merdequi]
MKKYFLLFTFLFGMFLGCSQGFKKTEITVTRADNSSVVLKVELAVTDKEQQQGFMHRKNIPDGTGMIFIYDADRTLNFWMKNTPHALTIAYIDKDGIIKEFHDMTPFSEAAVSSSHSVRYALEVPQGYFKRAGIQVGDKISLPQL